MNINTKTVTTDKTISTGFSIGGAMAMILSWSINHSIGLMFLHGVCGWFYVIYYYFTYYK